jgi:Tol biopolymer transport system component
MMRLRLLAAAAVGAFAIAVPVAPAGPDGARQYQPPPHGCRAGSEYRSRDPYLVGAPYKASADGRWLVFERQDGGRPLEFLELTGRRRLIVPRLSGPSVGQPPLVAVWSPRGAVLIAHDDANIFLVRPNGRVKRIARGCFGVWSPDGTRIAFTSRGRVYVAAVNGRARRVVARGEWVDDWAPDGRLLIVRVDDRAPNCAGRPTSRVSVLRLRNQRVIRVTGDAVVEEGRTWQRSEQGPASFSPNGRLIAFAENPPCGYVGRDFVSRPFVASLRPRVVRRVGRGRPSWLPRRSRLLLTGGRSSFEIVDERGRHHEFRGDSAGSAPALAPDGNRVVFGVQPDYRLTQNLYVAPVDRPDQARLLARNAHSPVWLPNGRRIAFLGHTENHCFALHVVRPDGSFRRRILPCR